MGPLQERAWFVMGALAASAKLRRRYAEDLRAINRTPTGRLINHAAHGGLARHLLGRTSDRPIMELTAELLAEVTEKELVVELMAILQQLKMQPRDVLTHFQGIECMVHALNTEEQHGTNLGERAQ